MRIGEPEFALGRELLAAEVNAAIEGAVEGGVEHVLVNDAHSTMHNLHPGRLHHGASYLSGAHKPLYMMEGLDASYDAVFMIAYHGSIGAERAILSHTYNPRAICEVRLNGEARRGERAQRSRSRCTMACRSSSSPAMRRPRRRPGRSCPSSRRWW